MKNNNKVSVVMTTYNGERYLREQINTIISQTIKADEFIICDDNSKDRTVEIIKEYLDEYPDLIKFFINENTLGYAHNFWGAIKKASGNIIILADQDDVWLSDKIETVVDFFNKHDDALSVNFAYRIINSKGEIVKDTKFMQYKNNCKARYITFKNFIKSPRYPGMSMAFKKELYDMISFVDEGVLTAHDWMLNQVASKNKAMFFYDRIVTYYRQHGNNTCGVNASVADDLLYKGRVAVIEDEIRNYNHLIQLYGNGDKYINQLNTVGNKRLELFKQGNIFFIAFYFLFNVNYIAVRGGIGDIYVTAKRKY